MGGERIPSLQPPCASSPYPPTRLTSSAGLACDVMSASMFSRSIQEERVMEAATPAVRTAIEAGMDRSQGQSLVHSSPNATAARRGRQKKGADSKEREGKGDGSRPLCPARDHPSASADASARMRAHPGSRGGGSR